MRPSRRAGFTLIELVLAAFVFAVGVLALEAVAVSSLRQLARSARSSVAVSVARSRLEMLAASRCDGLASGTDTVRSVISAWAVADAGSPRVREVSQTLTYAFAGATRTDTYRSKVACSE